MRTVSMIAYGVIAIGVFAGADKGTTQASTPKLSGFPSNLVWQNKPADWNAKDDSLVVRAGKKTDWFVWPGGGYTADNSPRLMFKTANDFTFSTKVDVQSHATYDAGCLALYGGVSLWAKLCLEAQSDGRLSVISVVTHERSDDATSSPASGTSIYLKVAKAEGAIFFYASQDGKAWTIVRKFNLESNDGLWTGFSTQSPDGEGASALFTDFRYLAKKINLWDLRFLDKQ